MFVCGAHLSSGSPAERQCYRFRLGLTVTGPDGYNEIRAQYAGFFLAAVGPTIRARYIIDAIGFAFHSCLSTHVSTASDRLRTEASVVSPKHDTAVQGVRRMRAWIGGESRLSATVIQTVGNKGYDGFLLAYRG
jgi:hypothetical protein